MIDLLYNCLIKLSSTGAELEQITELSTVLKQIQVTTQKFNAWGGTLNRRRRKEKRTLSGTSRRFGPRKWAKINEGN